MMCFTLLATHVAGHLLEGRTAARASEAAGFQSALGEAIGGMLTLRLSGWVGLFEQRLTARAAALDGRRRRVACIPALLDPLSNTSVDFMSVALAFVHVFALRRLLTPSLLTAYWIQLAVLHGRILDAPVNISAWRQGRAALDAFDSYLRSGDSSGQRPTATCVTSTAEAAASVVARRAAAQALEPHATLATHATLACDVLALKSGFAWGSGDASASAPLVACDEVLLLPSGSLTVLQGEVGAGKSTLLYGLLGEAKLVHGSVELRGIDGTAAELRPLISLVGQSPWLLAGSIRENILLGASSDFDADRYAAACEACCLTADLAALERGDAEHVGENGERLSGGQRQRVCLARAAYSRSPLVLLDDALSALDAHVAMQVFDECICKMMAGRTRLLISHSAAAAACADQVLNSNPSPNSNPTPTPTPNPYPYPYP